MRLLLVLALWVSGVSAASNPPFAPEDVFRLTWASDPQVSPDGSFIVFTYNYMDIIQDRRRSNLWRMDSDGDDIRPLTSGPSNNGTYLSLKHIAVIPHSLPRLFSRFF